MEKIRVENQIFPGLWFAGWLFTIGYLHLQIIQIIFALVIWPFYLGRAFAG